MIILRKEILIAVIFNFILRNIWHVLFVDEVELVKTIDGICNKVIFEVRNKQHSYELSYKYSVILSTWVNKAPGFIIYIVS